MKKNGRRTAWRLLALLLAALVLAGATAVGATGEGERTGSLKVMLKAETYAKMPKDAQVTLTLYKIGEADSSAAAGWRINDDLTGYGVLAAETSGKLGEIATKMASEIEGRYTGTSQKLTEGSTRFTALKPGVYLGAMTEGPSALKVTPFIVTVPAINPETKEMEYDYDVTVKDEYRENTPPPTPSRTPGTTTPPPEEPRRTRVTGEKKWEDNGDEHKKRPTEITVELYADGKLLDVEPVWTDKSADSWSYEFNDLPAENEEGEPIEYTVNEQPVEEYETEIVGTTITNKLIKREPKKETLKGKKTWNDKNNEDGKRPSYITVRLYCNGEEVASRMVTAATNWEYEFKDQIVDDGYGNKYSYKLEEDPVEGYFSQVKGLNVKNTRLPEKPSEPGKKRPPSYRKTGTPPPKFRKLREEELDELLDLFEYETPLWGGLLGTGDDTPVWPYAFAGAGVLALAALAVLDRRRRKAR